MEIASRKIAIIIVVITLLLFPVVAFTTGPLRIALVLPVVLFFPGYALLLALFPRRGILYGTMRVALSFGLSIAIVPLIGLALNYTPWGIKLYPILISITLFIAITSAIGWNRQRKLPEADRINFVFSSRLPGRAGMTKSAKALFVSTIILILVAIGCLGYVIAMPKQDAGFTEFYILGSNGEAEEYPLGVLASQPVNLIVGIVNHERQLTSYRVEIKLEDEIISQLNTGSLAHDQRWEQAINLTLKIPEGKQKIEFYLYNNDEVQPYFEAPLHLYINVY